MICFPQYISLMPFPLLMILNATNLSYNYWILSNYSKTFTLYQIGQHTGTFFSTLANYYVLTQNFLLPILLTAIQSPQAIPYLQTSFGKITEVTFQLKPIGLLRRTFSHTANKNVPLLSSSKVTTCLLFPNMTSLPD